MAALRGVPILRGLAVKTMHELSRRAREQVHESGTSLLGDGRAMSVILRGRAAIRAGDKTVADLGTGDSFGGPLVIRGAPADADVVAVDQVTTLVVETGDLEELMRIPTVARALIDHLETSASPASRPEDRAGAEPVLEPIGPQVPDVPSIAVLPFTNMSGDPEQEYFGDGLTEDLITDLAKLSGVLVIARNSVFTYKGKAVEVREVARDLGVGHVLEGSVRKAGNRVRITAQLIDASTGGHVWAERYDRDADDIFAVQDDVTRRIVAALSVELSAAEQDTIERRGTDDGLAYDHVLRGSDLLRRTTREGNAQARHEFEAALGIDPEYAAAHAQLGATDHLDWVLGYTDDAAVLEQARSHAERAMALDPAGEEGRYVVALVALMQHRHDEALAEMERVADAAPNDALALYLLATIANQVGAPERARDLIRRAMRLDPLYSFEYAFELGHAYFLMGKLDEAVRAFTSSITLNPEFHPGHFYLMVAEAERGREGEARRHLEALRAVVPDVTPAMITSRMRYRDPAVTERILAAVRKAGMEG
jgi:adenylate cyclase